MDIYKSLKLLKRFLRWNTAPQKGVIVYKTMQCCLVDIENR